MRLVSSAVQCLVHIGDDVKAVEDMQSLGAVFTDQLQIGFPHVGTDEYDIGNYVLREREPARRQNKPERSERRDFLLS